MRRSRRDPRSGFTLLEVMVAIGTLTVILATISHSFVKTLEVQRELSLRDTLDERVRRTLERCVNRVRESGWSHVFGVPDAPSTSREMSFHRSSNFDVGTGATWDVEERLFVRPVDGELLNGADDNGDGRIDEGVLTWLRGGQAVPWCSDVVEAAFSREGGRLVLCFRVEVVSDKGDLVRAERTCHVRLNN